MNENPEFTRTQDMIPIWMQLYLANRDSLPNDDAIANADKAYAALLETVGIIREPITKDEPVKIDDIAAACHAVNRALCESFGDHSQKPWPQADEWQISSAIQGVQFRLANPDAPESAQHDAWTASKLADGWKFGPAKDPAKKEHPCLIPFQDLPPEQKAKDALFCAVVDSLKPFLK